MNIILCGADTWRNPEPVVAWVKALWRAARFHHLPNSKIAEHAGHTNAPLQRFHGVKVEHLWTRPIDLVLAFHPFLPNSTVTSKIVRDAMVRMVPVVLVSEDEPSEEAVGKWLRYEPADPHTFLAEFYQAQETG